jgi:hypothetical protein
LTTKKKAEFEINHLILHFSDLSIVQTFGAQRSMWDTKENDTDSAYDTPDSDISPDTSLSSA